MKIRRYVTNLFIIIFLVLGNIFVVWLLYDSIFLPEKDMTYDKFMDGTTKESILSIELVTQGTSFKTENQEDIEYFLSLFRQSPHNYDPRKITSGLKCFLKTKSGRNLQFGLRFDSAPYGQFPTEIEIITPDDANDSIDIHKRKIPTPIPEFFRQALEASNPRIKLK